MKPVVIIGAGAHACDVAEIIHDPQSQSGLAVLGFVTDTEYLTADCSCARPILGDWSWFENNEVQDLSVICAIGDPKAGKRLAERAHKKGLPFASAISPSAYISPDARLGNGVAIFPQALIGRNVVVGDHAIVNAGATVGHDAKLGCFTRLSPGVHVGGYVSIGEGGYFGLGSSIIPHVQIGEWSTIGAGAVVTKDLPPFVTAAGVPARIIKSARIHKAPTGPAGQQANL